MKKDVLISITGLHYGDWNADGEEAEPIEVITPATYYLKNGKHYVIYDEVAEGMPGSVRNTVKITGDSMFEVTKSGRGGSRMVFEKDKMNMTNYQTPYGEVLVLSLIHICISTAAARWASRSCRRILIKVWEHFR